MKALVVVALAGALIVSGSSLAQSARGQAREMAGQAGSTGDGGRTYVEKDAGRGGADRHSQAQRQEGFRGGDQGRQGFSAQRPPASPFPVRQDQSFRGALGDRGNRPYPDQDRGRDLHSGSYGQNNGTNYRGDNHQGQFVRSGDGYRRDHDGHYNGGYRGHGQNGNYYAGGYYNGGYNNHGHISYGYTNYGYRDHSYGGHSYGYRYRAPHTYYRPHGYYTYNWRIGHRLPWSWYRSAYYVDYDDYDLYAPPYGYRWVRVDHDVFLVALTGGLIADILYDFYD